MNYNNNIREITSQAVIRIFKWVEKTTHATLGDSQDNSRRTVADRWDAWPFNALNKTALVCEITVLLKRRIPRVSTAKTLPSHTRMNKKTGLEVESSVKPNGWGWQQVWRFAYRLNIQKDKIPPREGLVQREVPRGGVPGIPEGFPFSGERVDWVKIYMKGKIKDQIPWPASPCFPR